MLETFLGILSGSVLITGLVIVMMMLIECFNVWSRGRLISGMKGSGLLQIVVSALLGAVPGCMGGFAVVSMYTHGMVSLGALVAMMIASSGDEAFVMLAMIPREALLITLGLTVLAIIVGFIVDRFHKNAAPVSVCTEHYAIHDTEGMKGERSFSWKRVAIILGVALFLAALCFGVLGEEEESEAEYLVGGINLLSEDWMNVMFAVFGLSVLVMAIVSSDHFVEEHLWHHIVREHLPKIFLWTAGALTVITLLLNFVDLSSWISDNVFLMILIAAAIGIIPESGPHMIFVTMFASGIVPLPVLMASCISQDGHSALPLLAEDRKSFIITKAINFVVAVAVGACMMLVPGLN